MNWMDWIIVGKLTVGALSTIAIVGQQRKPITPGVAVVVAIINGLLITGLVLTR